MKLFIAEEQNHSGILGRFLDREGIPRLTNDWVDGAFRRLRKLAGLDICAMTLVTAEVLAIPFYQALRDATRSALLRSICVRILCDEAAHLNYQALTIGLVRRPLGERARAVRAAIAPGLSTLSGPKPSSSETSLARSPTVEYRPPLGTPRPSPVR